MSGVSARNSPSIEEVTTILAEFNEISYPFNCAKSQNQAFAGALENFEATWHASLQAAIKPSAQAAPPAAVANRLAIDALARDEELERRRIRSIASETSFVDSARGAFAYEYLYSHAKSEMQRVKCLASTLANLAAVSFQLPTMDGDSKPFTPEQIFALIPQDIAAQASHWAMMVHATSEMSASALLFLRHMKTATQGGTNF